MTYDEALGYLDGLLLSRTPGPQPYNPVKLERMRTGGELNLGRAPARLRRGSDAEPAVPAAAGAVGAPKVHAAEIGRLS